MKLKSILDSRKRRRMVNRVRKQLLRLTRSKQQARPIFILGSQRSGTNMVFDYFENRSDTETYNESDKTAFDNYLIHPFPEIRNLLLNARQPVAVFKPICDSHRFGEFTVAFPDGAFLWLTRAYKDVANSAIRNFEFSDRAIRLVCEGKAGGGWFQRGVSPECEVTLKDIYHPDLSKFELACLVWWARNLTVLEQGIDKAPNTLMLEYEKLVTGPSKVFPFLCEVLGIPQQPRAHRHVHSRSIHRHTYPPVAERIERLCDKLVADLRQRTQTNHTLLRASSGYIDPEGPPA